MAVTDAQLTQILDARPEEYTEREVALALELRNLRAEPHDGFHTMTELYEQRMLWHAVAASLIRDHATYPGAVTKSWKHDDGESCFGYTNSGRRWFVVTVILPDGRQVAQHYPERDWDLFDVPELPVAPVWDGHLAAEGNQRLRDLLRQR